MSADTGIRWFALGLGLGLVHLLVLGWIGAWDPFSPDVFSCLCSVWGGTPPVGPAKGWGVLLTCLTVSLMGAAVASRWLTSPTAFMGFGTAEISRLDLLVAMAHASILSLGFSLVTIGLIGRNDMATALGSIRYLSPPAPLVQATGSAFLGSFLACLAWRAQHPTTCLRLRERISLVLTGILWVLVPVLIVEPPYFVR